MSEWIQVAPGTYMPPNGVGEMLQATYLPKPGPGVIVPAPNVWHTVSLARPALPLGLPVGAYGALLSGLVVMSCPESEPGIYGAKLAVRKGRSAYDAPQFAQGCAVNFGVWTPEIDPAVPAKWVRAKPSNGDRKPASVPVALNSAREFDYKYEIQAPNGGPPLTPGLDFQINFYVAMWWGLPDLFPYPAA